MAKLPVQQHLALKQIDPDKIESNPDNPRLFFRPEEMESLLLSIQKIGIQVPVSVYERLPGKYVLIDGERRTRCARKLNLNTIPALVQKKPSQLRNLLLMSSIHALREQWDYLTIALNLEKILKLYVEEHGEQPTEAVLSKETGLTRGQIRRCSLLINIPKKYRSLLKKELEKDKLEQKLTEDFFLEMEGSLRAVVKRFPKYGEELNDVRDTLIEKRQKGIINAVTDFRKLTKIATSADNIGASPKAVERTLDRIFHPESKVGIDTAYEQTVQFSYEEKRVASQVAAVSRFIDEALDKDIREFDGPLQEELEGLYRKLKRIFKGK